jgi:hypothetical protein
MPACRILVSRSDQTAYVRSARIQSCSFSSSYKMAMPWFGSPTSYASGYIRHQRTSVATQSLTVELSSPPTYWIGLLTVASSGSNRSKSEAGAVSGAVVVTTPG